MHFFISKRLPLGLRGGVIFPATRSFAKTAVPSAAITGSFVYVIKGAHNLIKIGISTNPNARIATLRTASPFPIDFAYVGATGSNGGAIEAEAHSILGKYRCQGEWFDVSPELAIAAVNGAAAKLAQSLVPVPSDRIDEVIRAAAADGSVPSKPSPRNGLRHPIAVTIILLVIFAVFTALSAAGLFFGLAVLKPELLRSLTWFYAAPVMGILGTWWTLEN